MEVIKDIEEMIQLLPENLKTILNDEVKISAKRLAIKQYLLISKGEDSTGITNEVANNYILEETGNIVVNSSSRLSKHDSKEAINAYTKLWKLSKNGVIQL